MLEPIKLEPTKHTFHINIKAESVENDIINPLSVGDINADMFEIFLNDCGREADLSDTTVIVSVVRPDGSVVPLPADVDGSTIRVTLDRFCYELPGRITLKVKLQGANFMRQVLAVGMNVIS